MTIANEGALPAGNFYAHIYLYDESTDIHHSFGHYYSTTFWPGVGEVPITPSTMVTVPEGTYKLKIYVDVNGDVIETDESNNLFIIESFTVNPANVDVAFTAFSASPTSLHAGESTEINFAIANTGESQIQGYVDNAFFLSADDVLDDSDIELKSVSNDIQLGGVTWNTSLSIPDVTSGPYFLIGMTDAPKNGHGPVFDEMNEMNNLALIPIVIEGPEIDLEPIGISSFSLQQMTQYDDDYIALAEFTLRNNGTTGSSNFKINYYLSEDAVFGNEDHLLSSSDFESVSSAIAGKETKVVSDENRFLDFPLTSGNYHLIIEINADHTVQETDYSNNIVVSDDSYYIEEPMVVYVNIDKVALVNQVSPGDKSFNTRLTFSNPSSGDFNRYVPVTIQLVEKFTNTIIPVQHDEPWVVLEAGEVISVSVVIGALQGLSEGVYALFASLEGRVTSMTFTVGDGNIVSGKVVGVDGVEFPKGMLHLYQRNTNQLAYIKSYEVDNSSTFSFQIAEADYTLYFIPDKNVYPDYLPTLYDKALLIHEAEYFHVNDEQVVTMEVLRLKPLATGSKNISGSVSSGNSEGRNRSFEGIPVTLIDVDGNPVALTHTDQAGHFRFGGVAEGEYTVVVGSSDIQDISTVPVTVILSEFDIDLQFNLSEGAAISRKVQSLQLAALSDKVFGDVPFALNVTSNSSQPVNLGSSNTDVAVIENGLIKIIGAGTSVISARQEGNDEWVAGEAQQQLVIEKASQQIYFAEFPEVTIDDATIELGATSSFGLPVSYTSSEPAVATVIDHTLTIHSAGSTEITAHQEGNANINPATGVTRLLKVNAVLAVEKNNNVQVYPNPTMGKVLIVGMRQPMNVTAIDSFGMAKSVQIKGNEIDLSPFAAGIYVLRIATALGSFEVRVVRM
jgi:hypothetical protein